MRPSVNPALPVRGSPSPGRRSFRARPTPGPCPDRGRKPRRPEGAVTGPGGAACSPSTGRTGPVIPAAMSAMDASTTQAASVSRAASTAAVAARPVSGSATASPQKQGVDPVPAHQAAGHRGVVAERHPARPRPLAPVPGDHQPHPGSAPRTRASTSRPSWSRARGLEAEITTSARETMPAQQPPVGRHLRSRGPPTPCPRSWPRRTPDRLPGHRRTREIDSILMTRAPARASNLPTSGPAHRAERSATTSPARDASGGAGRMRLELIPGAVPGTPVVLAVPAAGGRRSPRTARGRPRISARARSSAPSSPPTPASSMDQAPVGYRGGPLEERRNQLPVGRAGHGGGDPAVGRPQEAGGPAAADLAAPVVAGDGGPLGHQGEGIHPHRPAQPSRTPGDVGGQMPAAGGPGPPVHPAPARRVVRSGTSSPTRPMPSTRRSKRRIRQPPVVSFGRRPQYARGGGPHHRLVTIVEMDPVRLSGPTFAELLETGGVYELVVDSGAVGPGGRGRRPARSAPRAVDGAPPDPGRRGGGRGQRPGGPTPRLGRRGGGTGRRPARGGAGHGGRQPPGLHHLGRPAPDRRPSFGSRRPGGRIGGLRAPPGGPEFARWRAGHPARARPEPAGIPVRVSRQDQVLSITLDRPHVLNAFDAAMRDDLVAALEVAAADPSVTTVILRGNGESFCSGGDLDEFGSRPDPVTAHLVRLQRNAGRALAEVADRTTVHIHGSTVGSGIELAAFAHRVVARRRHPDRPPRGATGPRPRRRGDGQPAQAHRAPRHHAAGRRSPVGRRPDRAGLGPGR